MSQDDTHRENRSDDSSGTASGQPTDDFTSQETTTWGSNGQQPRQQSAVSQTLDEILMSDPKELGKREALSYGFRTIWNIILLVVAASIISFIGLLLIADGSGIIGMLVMLIGSLVWAAGAIGVLYKIIVDGVRQGFVHDSA